MGMASFVSNASWMIVAPQPTKRANSGFKIFYDTPPASSFKLHASYVSRHLPAMHIVKPASTIVKENPSFVENVNWSKCVGSNSLLFLGDLNHNDNKLKCNWRKTDAVANDEDKKPRIERRKSETQGNSRLWLYAIVAAASFCVFVGLCSMRLPKLKRPSNYREIPFSDLVGGIQDGSVDRVQFVENSREIYFNSKSFRDERVQTPETESLATRLGRAAKIFPPKWQYRTRNVEDGRYELLKMLKEKGITYGSNRELISPSMKNFLLIFFEMAPFWIMVLLSCYRLNVQLDLRKITKRKPSKRQSVTFDDVKGVDAAKAELLEVVLCMKGDNKYMKLGAKLPKGVLLTGPPGTGKTLLARAVAGEAKVSFFSISASELVEVFVGRGAARVRDLFREARNKSPSIIFIDEIDAVGGQRGSTLNCERDQTLNQLLTEMDGFEKTTSVVVIAATNRHETLDSALMRPGRFSRKVQVNVPDEYGRREIFSLYLRDVPMEADKKDPICQLVASRTPGLVGADLENIARESVLLAARRGGEFVTEEDIFEAVDRARVKNCEAKPFSFRPTTPDHGYGGAMGFGFSN